MTPGEIPTQAEIETLRARLDRDAEAAGYHLNPDRDFTLALAGGLLTNERRYGYRACPCRLATGEADEDRDIVCPCDYRDQDLLDHGSCYCGLYVSDEIVAGRKAPSSIPERRPLREKRARRAGPATALKGRIPVWRCRVCGYLCARERPPSVCPICKAKEDRFEPFG